MNDPSSLDLPLASTAEHPAQKPDSVRSVAWSAAAIRLLQGVLYQDEVPQVWETLLRYSSPVMDYFAIIGLSVVVDESEGMAYLRQLDDEKISDDTASLPRLFRRTPLGYDTTLLCVLLRDTLRQFEDEDLENDRCVISQHELLQLWQAFFPEQHDQVRLDRGLHAALRKLEELKFVRLFQASPPSWEIRRIIKARLPLEELERLRQSLILAVVQRKQAETGGSSSGDRLSQFKPEWQCDSLPDGSLPEEAR